MGTYWDVVVVGVFGLSNYQGWCLIDLVLMILRNVFQVGQLREVSNKTSNAELKLYLEVEVGLVMEYCILIFQFRVDTWNFCWGMLYFWVYQVLCFALFAFVLL